MNQRTAKLIRRFARTQINLVPRPNKKDYKRFWNKMPRPKRHWLRNIWEEAC